MNVSLYASAACAATTDATLEFPEEKKLVMYRVHNLCVYDRMLVNADFFEAYPEFYRKIMNRFIPTPIYRFLPSQTVFLKGSYYLLDNYFGNNYGHTTVQAIGPYLYARKANFFRDTKLVFATYRLSSMQKNIWHAFGIDERKVLYLKKGVTYVFEDCYVTNMYHDVSCLNAAVVKAFEEFRDTLVSRERAKKDFYITRKRGLARKASAKNEDDVLDLMKKNAFAIVDTAELTVHAQMQLFANAGTIVAAHGASGANLLYAGDGCSFVEIFPETWIQNYNAKILAYKDCSYAGSVHPAEALYLEKASDFSVDLDLLAYSLHHPLCRFARTKGDVAFEICTEYCKDRGNDILHKEWHVENLLTFCREEYVWANAAQRAIEEGRLTDARARVEKAHALAPDNLAIADLYVFILKALGMSQAAAAIVQMVQEKYPLWAPSL